MNKAIFFDRDGVLIKDTHNLISKDGIIFSKDLIDSFNLLKNSDFIFFIITNQAVVARGLASEIEVEKGSPQVL